MTDAPAFTYKQPGHGLHLVLTLLTFGFWLPVWIGVTVAAASHNRAVDRRLALLSVMSQTTVYDDDTGEIINWAIGPDGMPYVVSGTGEYIDLDTVHR